MVAQESAPQHVGRAPKLKCRSTAPPVFPVGGCMTWRASNVMKVRRFN
jgi:hypothetical protein